MCNVWPLASPPHCAIICSLHFPSPWGGHHQPYNWVQLYLCTKLPHPSPFKHLHLWFCSGKLYHLLENDLNMQKLSLYWFRIVGCIVGQNIQQNKLTFGRFGSFAKLIDFWTFCWQPCLTWLRVCAPSSANIVDIHSCSSNPINCNSPATALSAKDLR